MTMVLSQWQRTLILVEAEEKDITQKPITTASSRHRIVDILYIRCRRLEQVTQRGDSRLESPLDAMRLLIKLYQRIR
jgi:hypothetical protein